MSSKINKHDNVLCALTNAIGIINVIKNLVPNQLAQGILATTSQILVIIKDTLKNKEDFLELIEECLWVGKLIQETHDTVGDVGEANVNLALHEAMNALSSDSIVNNTYTDVEKMVSRTFYRRIFGSAEDKEKIQSMTAQLDRSLRNIQAALHFDNSKTLKRVEKNLLVLNIELEFQASRVRRHSPPPRPSIFYGREDLVHRIIKIALAQNGQEQRHIALLGSGGIGKSSLAKAVLNERSIVSKFGSRRFFVRFDDILASQITYPTFIDRISRALGITTAADHGAILHDLQTQRILLVLDNAETFLDSHASQDVSHIKTAIGEIGSLAFVSIILTSRSRDLPRGLVWEEVEVPNLDPSSAFDTFTKIHTQDVSLSRSAIEEILSSVDYHALTITLLAHTSIANKWSIETLRKRWGARRTDLFSSGKGKDENLAESIELSLDSPCVRAFGDDVRRVFRILAFFPQGLPQDKLEAIFPSIPKINDIVDALHKQYLVVYIAGFATMPAPFRLYANDRIPHLDISLLKDARAYYFRRLSSHSDVSKPLVLSEDVNIESLVIFDLQNSENEISLMEIMRVCQSFLICLRDFKLRPTALRGIIEALDCSRAPAVERLKVGCLWSLSDIAFNQSNYLEYLELNIVTYDLAVKLGDHDTVLAFTLKLAHDYLMLGRYQAARCLLDDARARPEWNTTKVFRKALWCAILGEIREMVDETLTGRSLSAVYQEAVNLYASAGHAPGSRLNCSKMAFAFALVDGGGTTRSREELQHIMTEAQKNHETLDPNFFRYLGAVAFLEGDTEEAKRLVKYCSAPGCALNTTIASACHAFLCLAVIMAYEGKCSDAKDLIRQVDERLKASCIISDQHRWRMLYTSGAVALISGDLSEAYRLFQETKKYCESRQEFHFRALAVRAMGEVRYLRKEFEEAREYFRETVAICDEAGIVPALLYRRSNIVVWFSRISPATCEGWPLFLKEISRKK